VSKSPVVFGNIYNGDMLRIKSKLDRRSGQLIGGLFLCFKIFFEKNNFEKV
jgi:hypothetical protein